MFLIEKKRKRKKGFGSEAYEKEVQSQRETTDWCTLIVNKQREGKRGRDKESNDQATWRVSQRP